MENKLFEDIKGVKEYEYTSISKHNAANETKYILFDPPNLTSFKCVIGRKDGKDIYIKEKLACMWGNEEIEEYVLLDDEYTSCFALPDKTLFEKNKTEYVKAKVGDTNIEYTHKKGMFSRFIYNVWFEYGGNKYYLFIKTCNGKKFKVLMEEFIEKAII